MLDPNLPWLAAGYRNFKEKEFLRPHSAMDGANHRYLENGSNNSELRSTTLARHQHRRVKSATHVRVHNGIASNVRHRLSARPRSARTTDSFRNEKVGCYNYSPGVTRALSLSRRPKSASGAFLRHHRPSTAQNKSVTQVERLHHSQERLLRQYEADTGEEVQHSCAFCPVECRPASSSSHRPMSSTGLLAAHLPTHFDLRTIPNRPRTAPTTRREASRLPRHNNVRRGQVPYYSNFVSKLPLHPRDCTPSPPPHRRRQAFQEEQTPVAMVMLDDDDGEEEDEEINEELLGSELDIEEDIAEPVQLMPSPLPPQIDELPKPEPPEEAMEAWTLETIAPTPTPVASRRNSEQEPQIEVEMPPSPIPQPPEKPMTPPPPPRKSPTPPPKNPTPQPPKSPTPPPAPPQLTSRPPKECAHKPKAPIPPLPRVKKEVRIQEPPKEPPKEKVIVKKEKKPIEVVKKVVEKPVEPPAPAPAPVKPALKKTPSIEPEPEVATPPKVEPPPLPSLLPEPVTEPEPEKEIIDLKEETPVAAETSPLKEEPPPAEEKKKLGPPPKVKVDVFSMDPQTMRELLNIQMMMKRRGQGSLSDDEDEPPHPSLASLVEPTSRMLKNANWLRGRIALSRRAARFELPMDVRDLEEMTPREYLLQYCIISQRRRALYKKAFVRVDKDNDGKINRKELEKGVLDALVDTIQPDKVAMVLGYLEEEETLIFPSRFFATFCALLERLFYKDFMKDDIGEKKEEKEKELLEEADFCGLDWKLKGQYVNPALKKLLYMI